MKRILSGLSWPLFLGIGCFALIMSLLMTIFKETDGADNGFNGKDNWEAKYPFNPVDLTDGGQYPNPNEPSRPITFLPPGQGGGSIYPVPPDKIITDPVDSMRQVVSDRVNVLLEKKNDTIASSFMQEFKRLYPDNDYQFVYFDTLSYRMQMVVPPDKRNYLKDHLNEQMPDYDFLLFDEEVFSLADQPGMPLFLCKENLWYFEPIHVLEGWGITRGDSSVVVAIVDNGFDLNHPALRDKVVKPINIPERNQHIFPIIDKDGKDHGTHVAATAVGNAHNIGGAAGIALDCGFMPVQVATADGLMLSSSVMDGVLYAVYNGASVVNVSLGPIPPEWFSNLSAKEQQRYIADDDQRLAKVWEMIYHIANKRGCTVVISAGNENVLSGYASKARSDSVIVVSAVNESLRKASFSNYGRYSNLPVNYSTVSAPGVNIYSAINGGNYAYLNGTSMAAPIVTGTIALMKSLDKQLTTVEISEFLQSNGLTLSGPIGPLIQIESTLKAVLKKKQQQ